MKSWLEGNSVYGSLQRVDFAKQHNKNNSFCGSVRITLKRFGSDRALQNSSIGTTVYSENVIIKQ